MKIIIICNCASGLFDFRGMLISKLIERNDVSAIVPVSDDEHEILAEKYLEKIGTKLFRIYMERRSINPAKDLGVFLSYSKLLKIIKPDLVITYTIKPNIYGSLACTVKNVPYAVNITGLGTAFEKENLVKKLVCFLYKIALKKAKVVFFENIENKSMMVDRNLVKEDKTVVLSGAGVDINYFTCEKYPKDDAETRFLFIGRVMQEKGVEELFESMEKLQNDGVNCKLDVLGEFEEDYADRLEVHKKQGWLRYHGYQDDVRPFIKNCHCFVLPSWHEGMANTNLESAATGRPVITSNIHGCMEAVIDGKSGFLCEIKDANSLYEAMKKFCLLPYEQKEAMGVAGREHMEKVFDKEKVVKKTIENLI